MFWPDRLRAQLRRLYRAAEPAPSDMSSPPAALEQRLLAQHARRYPAAADAPGAWGFLRAHRVAALTGVAALAVVAACQLPVDYERRFGVSVACTASVGEDFAEAPIHALADHLEARTGAEHVAIRAMAHQGEDPVVRIDLWGAETELDGDDMLAEIETFAALPPASCHVEPLVGTVHGTLGGRLGVELFDLELLDRDDAEAARARLLAHLEEHGLEGVAQVEISDDGEGKREVRIRIEAKRELEDPPAPP